MKHHIKGFSLLEVLTASALLALWLPSSLYTLQLALSQQQALRHRAEQAEAIMTLKQDITTQWLRGEVTAEHDRLTWQLQSVDGLNAILTITGADYDAQFWLTRPDADPVE